MAIALPEKQRKIANLSQALQLHLASGYKLVITELLDAGTIDRQRKPLAQACHRALTELGATILRAQQLYTASPSGSWHESHQLFRFARQNNLHTLAVQDDQRPHRSESTVADAYCQTLLLGCARANQLRQNELEQASELFELWSPRVQCAPELAAKAVFLVDMDSDKPPCYRSLAPDAEGGHWWGFDTGPLAEQISDHLRDTHGPESTKAQASKPGATGDLPLLPRSSDTLLTHLGQALALLTQRNFNRLETDGQLEVCAGLTAVHYFVAGEKPFAEFVVRSASTEAPDNRFMKPARRDAWSDAFDAGISDESAHWPIHPSTTRSPAQGATLPRHETSHGRT